MSVLVYIENTEGQFKKSAFEIASYAQEIASQQNTQAVAISIGDVAEDELKKLGEYGISKVLNVSSDKLKTFVNQAYASIIAKAVESENAKIVVLSNSFNGKAIAPRISTKLNAALATGVSSLPIIDGSSFQVKKTTFSNKAIATVLLNSDIKVLTVNPNSFAPKSNKVDIAIESFDASATENDFGTIVKDIVRSTDKISLPEAEIVVSAGRGMKGPEHWAIIEELAEVLGAATACSKPVSDAGWRPHSEHVGQTGIVVSPKLYIAIGISGAIQHLAGVSSSKTIVVINKDPEAPFFKVADYGIVGDAFTVVPKLIEALKNHKKN